VVWKIGGVGAVTADGDLIATSQAVGDVVPAPRPGRPTPGPALPRTAVVLAAGRSERLRNVTGGGSKALVRLGGLTLIERVIRDLLSYGIERVVVVVGYQAGAVGAVAARAAPGRVHLVYAEGWEAGNGASLAAAREAVEGEALFALVTTDHVFSEGALLGLLSAAAPAALLDLSPGPAAWEEGTKVLVRRGRALAFGKGIGAPGIDCGAFLLPPEVFAFQAQAQAEGDGSLAGALTRLARARKVRVVPLPRGAWWQDIDTPEDLRRARRLLRRSLVREADGPVSRHLNRPISTRLSMALAPLRPPPDLVSVVALVAALVAAWFLARGAGVAGGLLVHVASVLDGVDGEVARLQLRHGPRGALLDGILDRVADAAVLAGLGLWALSEADSEAVVLLVAGATTGSMLSMASKDRIAALGLPRPRERVLGLLLGGRDGRLFLVSVGAVLGRPVLALAAVGVASSLSVVVRVGLVRLATRRRRADRAPVGRGAPARAS
jgi:choline kinase/phosphatidylglycerophosphate synthase